MSTALSRKEQRKLKKSMNTTKTHRSPAKSDSSSSIGAPSSTLHSLFKPPSPTQEQEHALIATALIRQAKAKREIPIDSNATAERRASANCASVMSDDSDASIQTILYTGPSRDHLAHEPILQCTLPGYFGDTHTTGFDAPRPDNHADYTEDEEDFHTAVESPTTASSPVPIINPRTRPSAIPTARPSPDFGFALKRSNNFTAGPSEFEEHASQVEPYIGGRTNDTGNGNIGWGGWEDTTTVRNQAPDWGRKRQDSAVSLIFPLSPRSKAEMNRRSPAESSSALDTFDTSLDRSSTMRYNPLMTLRYVLNALPTGTASGATSETFESPRPGLLPSPAMSDDMPAHAVPDQQLAGPVHVSHENSRTTPARASILPSEEVDPNSKHVDDPSADMYNDLTFGRASRRDHGWEASETGMLHAFFHCLSPYNDTTMALTHFGLRSMPVLWRAIALRSVMWTDPPRMINGYPNLTQYWVDEAFEVISYEEKLSSWLVKRLNDHTGRLGWVQKADFAKILPPAMNSMPRFHPQYAQNVVDNHGLGRRHAISARGEGSDCAQILDHQESSRQSSADHIYHTVQRPHLRFLTEAFQPTLPEHGNEQLDGAATAPSRAGSPASDRSFSSVNSSPSLARVQWTDAASVQVSPEHEQNDYVLTSVRDGITQYVPANYTSSRPCPGSVNDNGLYEDSSRLSGTVTQAATSSRPSTYDDDEGLYDEAWPNVTVTEAAIPSSPAASAVSDPCSSPDVGRCVMPHDLAAHEREQAEKVIARLEASKTLERQSRQDHFPSNTIEMAFPVRAQSQGPLTGPATTILPSSTTESPYKPLCALEVLSNVRARVQELEEMLKEEQKTTEAWRRRAVDFETEVHELRKHDKDYKTHLKISLEARSERRRVQEELRSASHFQTMRANTEMHLKKIVDDYELKLQQERTKYSDNETSWRQYITGNVQPHRQMMAEQDAVHRAEIQKIQERHHRQMVYERAETDATRQQLCTAKESHKKIVDGLELKLQLERAATQMKFARHERVTEEFYVDLITETERDWQKCMADQKASHQKELQELKETHLQQMLRGAPGGPGRFYVDLVAEKKRDWQKRMAEQKALHEKELQELKETHLQQILKGGPGHLEALLSESMLDANFAYQLKRIYTADESLRPASTQCCFEDWIPSGMPGSSADNASTASSSATTAHSQPLQKTQLTSMTSSELKRVVRPELGTEGPAFGSTAQEKGLLVEAVKRGIVVPPALTVQRVEAVASTSGKEVESPTCGLYRDSYDWSSKLNEADGIRATVRSELETNLAKELMPAAVHDASAEVYAIRTTPTIPTAFVNAMNAGHDRSTGQVTTLRNKSALSTAIANMREAKRDEAQRRAAHSNEAPPHETWRVAYWNGMPAPMSGTVGEAGGVEHVEHYSDSVELAAPMDVPAAILSGRGENFTNALGQTYPTAVVDMSVARGFTSHADVADLYDSVEIGTVVEVPAALVDLSGEHFEEIELGAPAPADVPGLIVDMSGEESESFELETPAPASGDEGENWVQIEHSADELSAYETEDEEVAEAEDESQYDGDDEVTTDAEE